MNSKIVKLLALIALLFGSAVCQSTSSISLRVYESSSVWWLAVDPVDEGDTTSKVELQEASSSTWTAMTPNADWGYWQLTSTQGNGFSLPLSFRLTDASGNQVVVSQALSTITPGAVINTQASYASASGSAKEATQAPNQKATSAPNQKATSAPTQKATSAPNQKATAAPTSGPTDLCTITPTSSEPLKVLVPLYVDPGTAWDELITAAATGVPIIAIINPNNGPDKTPGSAYTTYMQKFKDAGITMVGYVHTSFASRAVADVIADIDTYASAYPGLSGIFVDECATAASDVSYYQQLYTHINGIEGYVHDILNPGTQPDEGYVAVSSSVVIFEDVASNLKSNFASWVKCAPSASEKAGYKYKFTGIAYAATAGEVVSLLSTMEGIGMGMVYVTDGSDSCCVYNSLASYFTAEAADVLALN